jgi:hypothetical protein
LHLFNKHKQKLSVDRPQKFHYTPECGRGTPHTHHQTQTNFRSLPHLKCNKKPGVSQENFSTNFV